MLSEETRKEIEELKSRYPCKRAALTMAVHAVAREKGALTPDDLAFIAEELDESPAEIQSAVSFYDMFKIERPVKYRIRVCTSVSCMIRGSDEVVGHLRKALGIGFGETTPDGLFELEEVECFGACDRAPSISINDEQAGPMTSEKIDQLIDDCRRGAPVGEDNLR
jgi:NADH-quinone oxidoreductase subunit E